MTGLSTMGSISLGTAFEAGKNRVPSPAAGTTAFRTRLTIEQLLFRSKPALHQRLPVEQRRPRRDPPPADVLAGAPRAPRGWRDRTKPSSFPPPQWERQRSPPIHLQLAHQSARQRR